MPKLRAWRPGFDRNAPKVWNAETAERVACYPKSPEAYEAMRERSRATALETHAKGGFNRRGVPDGWGGHKTDAMEARLIAGDEAAHVYRALRRHNGGPVLDDDERFPTADDARADYALAHVFGIYRDPTVPSRLRMQAARLFLSYTLPIPERGKQADMRAEDVLTVLSAKLGLPPAPPLTKRV